MNWIKRTITKHDLSQASQSLASLAKKYGSTAKEIAQKNGISWTPSAINAWVLKVGGREVTPGNFSFTAGNEILLPAKALIPDPSEARMPPPVVASQSLFGSVPWWAWPILIGGPIFLYRKRKQRKKAGRTPKPVLFG